MKVSEVVFVSPSKKIADGGRFSEDELQNIDMAEDEKDKKRHELKTKNRGYTGYDDDEFASGTGGLNNHKSVLAKYNEVINGEQEGNVSGS